SNGEPKRPSAVISQVGEGHSLTTDLLSYENAWSDNEKTLKTLPGNFAYLRMEFYRLTSMERWEKSADKTCKNEKDRELRIPATCGSKATRSQGRCPAGHCRTHRGMQFVLPRAADFCTEPPNRQPQGNRPNESGKIGKRRHRFVKVGTASRIGIFGARRYVRTVNFFRPREVVVNPN